MTTWDNMPPLEGWQAQPGKHCGQICLDRSCPVCGERVPQPGDNVVLGSE